jgi:hypothetical protein
MNTKLCEVKPGTVIPFGGMDWIVLESEGNMTRLLAKESIGEMPFDDEGYNNFNISSLREYLNDGFIEELKENGADVTALCDFTIDLTSDDGLKDYGNSTNKVNLLTCDMYRKYRHLIPNLDYWWWLATAYSTKSNGYSNYVRLVRTDGTLNYSHAYNGTGGVRPALTLKSDIFLSTESELGKYTATELLEELMRRNHGIRRP